MCVIIQFPKTVRAEQFYRFVCRWSDGAVFTGDTVEECFRKQKDAFEPEFTMDEYLERFRTRLEVVTGTYYGYSDVAGLVDVLKDNGYLEVIRKDVTRSDSKLS